MAGATGYSSRQYWCPECGSEDLDESLPAGDAVCDDCGNVIDDLADATERPDLPEETDEESDDVSWSEFYTVRNSTEKRVALALEELEAIGDSLDLSPDTRKQAAELYAEAAVVNLVDGRPTETVVAGVVILAARAAGTPRPTGRVARSADVSVHTLGTIVKQLGRELDDVPGEWVPATAYLPFLLQEFELDENVGDRARSLLKAVDESQRFVGKNRASIAGAAIYLASDGVMTQYEVARAAGVSGETIRQRLLELRSEVDEP